MDPIFTRRYYDNDFNTISIDELVMRHYEPMIRELGHEYHWSDKLLTPTDPTEAELLGLQHNLFRVCLGGELTLSDIDSEQRNPKDPIFILDIGTGTAAWAIEMAHRFPQAIITALDLTMALLPQRFYDYPNLCFKLADVTAGWDSELFDFIYMRDLIGGGIRDWERLVTEAASHLYPNGQLEFVQLAPYFTLRSQSYMAGGNMVSRYIGGGSFGRQCIRFRKLVREACAVQGLDFNPASTVLPRLQILPFMQDVKKTVFYLPTRSRGLVDPLEKGKAEMVQIILPRSKFYQACGPA